MCKAPKVSSPEINVPTPQVLSNPFLDNARGNNSTVAALRAGRSSLRIPLDNGLGIGFTGRSGGTSTALTSGPQGNARRGPGLISPLTNPRRVAQSGPQQIV